MIQPVSSNILYQNGRQLATEVASGKDLAYTYDTDGDICGSVLYYWYAIVIQENSLSQNLFIC